MKAAPEKLTRRHEQILSGAFSITSASGVFWFVGFLVIFFCLSLRAQACGLTWSEPKSHFDGVDYQGNVMVIERLGEVDAGQGVVLPLYMAFGSASVNNSPYGGYGWTLPLLESKIVQQDENTFKMEQPDGWFRLLWRDKNNPDILSGQGNWKAEIIGDTVTAHADCGVKLVYRRGRLVSMQLKERTFDFIYEGNIVTELREGGAVLLWVQREQATGEVTGFKFSNNRVVSVERDKRPRVEVISKQNVVGGMENSLSKVIQVGEKVQSVEYGLDEKLNPTIKMENRVIVWNPETKKVMKDGEWTYDIKPGTETYGNAAIGRESDKKQKEFWFLDQAKGEETVLDSNGIRKVKTWFTSGKLIGKTRKIEKDSKVIYQVSYDDHGRMIREVRNTSKGVFTYNYSYALNQMVTETQCDGVSVGKETVKYDDLGRKIEVAYEKRWEYYSYTKDNSYVKTTVFSNGKKFFDTIEDGLTKTRTDPQGSEERFVYDYAGKLVQIVNQKGVVRWINQESGSPLIQ